MFKSIFAVALVLVATFAQADRIRDLTSVQGVRENSLIGYGLVVGWTVRVTRPPKRHSRPRA
jgi:flagellar P-ring protein precursor FlgI